MLTKDDIDATELKIDKLDYEERIQRLEQRMESLEGVIESFKRA